RRPNAASCRPSGSGNVCWFRRQHSTGCCEAKRPDVAECSSDFMLDRQGFWPVSNPRRGRATILLRAIARGDHHLEAPRWRALSRVAGATCWPDAEPCRCTSEQFSESNAARTRLGATRRVYTTARYVDPALSTATLATCYWSVRAE